MAPQHKSDALRPTNLRIEPLIVNESPSETSIENASAIHDEWKESESGEALLSPMKTNSRCLLHFLMFNDVYSMTPNYNGVGGLAELSSIIQREKAMIDGNEGDRLWREKCDGDFCREESPVELLQKNVFTILTGDFCSASSLALKYKGKHMIDVLNEMNLDFVVPGNHEFDFGVDVLRNLINHSNFQWLATNIIEEKTGDVLENCLRLKVFDTEEGFRVGMWGVCTQDSTWLSKPNSNTKEGERIFFVDVIETSKKMVKELKEKWKCDVLIALTHLSMSQDVELAKAVPEIDVILGGHDHSPQTWKVGRTLVHKAGSDAEYLTHLKLYLERKTNYVKGKALSRTQVYHEWSMLSNHSEAYPDPKVLEVIERYTAELPKDNKDEIALFLTDVSSVTEDVRSRESTFANFVADAVKSIFKCDIALINGGTLRGDRIYSAGYRVKKEDIRAECPFGGHFQLASISGDALLGALEDGLSRAEQTLGSFPHCSSGVSVEYDVTKEPGKRIVLATLNGHALEPKKTYTLGTTEYMLQGGDNYEHLKTAKKISHPTDKLSMSDFIIRYCMKHQEFEPRKEGRIFLTGSLTKPVKTAESLVQA
eukprot:CAMPEP_0117445288 /NCGR_PEP_ID=MMETSP0759-20121206/5713_1 /TAXON_ID=63605 /ORGANISM="Percolomonas cosmopolitus, Strain WS" /LENGTH=595 /DNA_ID=CAMNT_0005237449 /DNA_START=9 /DNA_END=1796 /DNA_ORIENTATION=-